MNGRYPTLFSKPVYVSPSLDSLGASKQVGLFGHFSYFIVHQARGPLSNFVKRYDEAPGYVERGIIGYRLFDRYDVALLWNDIIGERLCATTRNWVPTNRQRKGQDR